MSLSFIFWVTRRSYLHLSELEWILPAGPGGPLDAVGVRGVLAAQVLAVEVGRVTVAVPPGAMIEGGAVVLRVVVVAVFGGELHAVVLQKRVACGAKEGCSETKKNDAAGLLHCWVSDLKSHLSILPNQGAFSCLTATTMALLMLGTHFSIIHQLLLDTRTGCFKICSSSK